MTIFSLLTHVLILIDYLHDWRMSIILKKNIVNIVMASELLDNIIKSYHSITGIFGVEWGVGVFVSP